MLPVDLQLPEILAALDDAGAVVVEAPPGTGKTTRIPAAVAGRFPGQVWVLEPRRVAARAAARRVSAEHQSPVGGFAGYAMRFERSVGPETRVLYVTEALLGRRLASDPRLDGISCVILDEFHERSIHTDVALARIHALRGLRPDLRLVVMSATFDGEAVARWLGCPRVRVSGTMFPVAIRYLARPDDRPLERAVEAGVHDALRGDGDVLVFLPGLGEIERCAECLRGVDADVLPLHGELDGVEQDRVLTPGRRRRVILATNVAETSLTVEGVQAVVDTGLARVAGFDPWSGMGVLTLQPISRASAAQRAGRAGRTGPGRCLRLYTQADHDGRPAEAAPELSRVDLAATRLELRGAELSWYEPPPTAAWRAADDLLRLLGARTEHGLSAVGEAMLALPVPPRVGRMLVEALALGVGAEGAALAAVLGERRRETTDVVHRTLDTRLGGLAERERRQLWDALGRPRDGAGDVAVRLTRALYAGFPDRVGQRRAGTVRMAAGGSALLDGPGQDGFVVVPAVERVGARALVRGYAPIPADWLVDRAEVRERVRVTGERIELVEQLVVGDLVVDETVGRGRGPAAEEALRDLVRPIAHRVFPDAERADLLARRVAWLRRVGADMPSVDLEGLIIRACAGCASVGELRGVSLVELAWLGELQGRREEMDRLAPEAIPLGNRKRAPVDYPADQEPFLASRMQDFFGLSDGPRLAGGRPLVLHLNAPSGRPVQITSDLAGFWTRHYPAIRRELMRRYPRQFWPENPHEAEPPPEGRRR